MLMVLHCGLCLWRERQCQCCNLPLFYLQKRHLVVESGAIGPQPPYQNSRIDVLVNPGIVLDGRHPLREAACRHRFFRLHLKM